MRPEELQRPLSSAEFSELRDFLDSVSSAMSLSKAEGFLTGVASAPETLMPSDWQPRILGEHTFRSSDEAGRVFGLIVRLFNEILTGLNQDRAVRPSASLAEEEVSEWCRGYLEASRMDAVWRTDEHGQSALLPFAVLAGEFDLVGEEDVEGHLIEDPSEHIQKYRRSLSTWVLDFHKHWVAWRRDAMQTPALPAGSRVGRNERCPCGSGRKYKKCCGA